MKVRNAALLSLAVVAVLTGCASMTGPKRAPVALVPDVDIARFMGDWYVIANIPTFVEKGAHNAVESYRLNADGTIDTTFSFNDGAANGPLKTYHSRGFVLDNKTKAVWGQQYVWPLKADYRISWLSPDYSTTVITREKRDHVWILSRKPTMPEAEVKRLTDFIASQGYDATQLQRVPQSRN